MRGVAKKLDFHSLSYQHTLHCSKSSVHMAGAGEEAPTGCPFKNALYTPSLETRVLLV